MPVAPRRESGSLPRSVIATKTPTQAPLPLEAGRRYRAKIGSRLLLSAVEMAVERVDGSSTASNRPPITR